MTHAIERFSTPLWLITAAVLLLASAAVWRVSPRLVVGILAGGAWNLANLWCLTQLFRAWLEPSPSRRRAIIWLLLKFPVLYLLAFGLLRMPSASLLGFGIGFTVVLVAAMGWFALQAQQMIARSHGR